VIFSTDKSSNCFRSVLTYMLTDIQIEQHVHLSLLRNEMKLKISVN